MLLVWYLGLFPMVFFFVTFLGTVTTFVSYGF